MDTVFTRTDPCRSFSRSHLFGIFSRTHQFRTFQRLGRDDVTRRLIIKTVDGRRSVVAMAQVDSLHVSVGILTISGGKFYFSLAITIND